AVKEGNAWKLAPVAAGQQANEDIIKKMAKDADTTRTFLTRQREITEKTTKDLKEGKYKARADAEKAYNEALFAAVLGQGPGGGTFRGTVAVGGTARATTEKAPDTKKAPETKK